MANRYNLNSSSVQESFSSDFLADKTVLGLSESIDNLTKRGVNISKKSKKKFVKRIFVCFAEEQPD